jgi:hypothetical protein
MIDTFRLAEHVDREIQTDYHYEHRGPRTSEKFAAGRCCGQLSA